MIKYFFAILFLSSCHFFAKKEIQFTEYKIEIVPRDFKIPKKIFSIIEDQIYEESKNLTPVYIYTPLEAILFSEADDVLSQKAIKIKLPNGGGSIDLKELVIGEGSFFLSFPQGQFLSLPPLVNLFYISNISKKEIDQEVFGLGCGAFVDLSPQFEKLQKIDYLKLNTNQKRYVYSTAGYYIFVFREKNKVYLSHLQITDSRYEDIMCSSLYTK